MSGARSDQLMPYTGISTLPSLSSSSGSTSAAAVRDFQRLTSFDRAASSVAWDAPVSTNNLASLAFASTFAHPQVNYSSSSALASNKDVTDSALHGHDDERAAVETLQRMNTPDYYSIPLQTMPSLQTLPSLDMSISSLIGASSSLTDQHNLGPPQLLTDTTASTTTAPKIPLPNNGGAVVIPPLSSTAPPTTVAAASTGGFSDVIGGGELKRMASIFTPSSSSTTHYNGSGHNYNPANIINNNHRIDDTSFGLSRGDRYVPAYYAIFLHILAYLYCIIHTCITYTYDIYTYIMYAHIIYT